MEIRNLMLAVSLAALTVTTGCKKMDDTNAPSMTVDQSTAWGIFLAGFLDSYFPINPTFSVYQGKHEFDGQLPDWSEEGLKKLIDIRKKAIARCASNRCIKAQRCGEI